MYSKIEITGKIEVVTGMHIGGSEAFAAIGAIDSPIIKDTLTNKPIIPGSSLKGKLRTLLAREYNDKITEHENDDERILRLFGSAKNKKGSRILISDMQMSNEDELRERGLTSLTEVKYENTIKRTTGVANPRQIERAIRGTQFDLSIIYEVSDENINEIEEDIDNLILGMKLLQYDYLGGSGSRGYGKVKFNELYMETVIGEIDDDIIDRCNEKLKDV
ncbi:MAG: type III-A CRISPR-associated RAMP protein Csm3 [Lachnospiraceae bacterium]|nr:type III-A CRISPR-associated RAMP protein Csm3 [Lachnospiraceae bacterium]